MWQIVGGWDGYYVHVRHWHYEVHALTPNSFVLRGAFTGVEIELSPKSLYTALDLADGLINGWERV